MIQPLYLNGTSVKPGDCMTPSSERCWLRAIFPICSPSITLPSMVLRDGWRDHPRKVDRVGRVLRGPSDTCSASFSGHRRARLPRTRTSLGSWVNRLLVRTVGREAPRRVDDAKLYERTEVVPHSP